MPDGVRSNHGLHLLNEGARLLIFNWVTEMESLEPRGGTERHRGPALSATHVFVRNDVRDVLQDQLGPLSVLVQFLEEHARFEIP